MFRRHIGSLGVYVSTDYEYPYVNLPTDKEPLVLKKIAGLSLLIVCCVVAGGTQDSPAPQAGKNKPKDAQVTKKRVWTNDDFSPTGNAGTSASVVAPQSPTGTLEEFRNLTKEDLGAAVLQMAKANVDFPGRREWEQRLFDAKQAMVDQAKRMEGHKDANLDVQRQEIRSSQEATTNFKIIASEGIQKAQAENDPKLKAHLRYENLSHECLQYSPNVINGRNLQQECWASLESLKKQMLEEGTW
jgi:hypothetical protein